jgi:hypothetical protein
MNVETIFKQTAADAKGRYVSPTPGSTEWNQWLGWLNEELDTFGEVHDWKELRREVPLTVSGSSVALPSNFKKIAGLVTADGDLHEEVPEKNYDLFTSDSKVYKTGYDDGWYANFKGVVGDATIPLYSYPTSVATTTDEVRLRNPIYIVKRLKVRVFKYRQDPIFTELESEADLLLSQMIENEYYHHGMANEPLTNEEEHGFILGLD